MPSHSPGGLGAGASNQPGAVPILDGAPTAAELPTDADDGEPAAVIYLDTTDETVKVAAPDGSGGVATGDLLDLSASIDLGTGDETGLL